MKVYSTEKGEMAVSFLSTRSSLYYARSDRVSVVNLWFGAACSSLAHNRA